MAKNTTPAPMVRYRVLAKCFFNGSMVEPGGGPTFVMGPPGLQGKALELAPEKVAPEPPPLLFGSDAAKS